MKVIYNRLIPFKGFTAINIFGICFMRSEYKKLEGTPQFKNTLRHESIHTAQMKELGYIGFYIIYILEWLYRLIMIGGKDAYRTISFEVEARDHDHRDDYLSTRKPYSQWRS